VDTQFHPLEDAIRIAGSVSALAARIGVNQNVVSNWRARGSVPSDKAPRIERETGVLVESMCPDAAWTRIPDLTWPVEGGRPVIDPAKPSDMDAPPEDQRRVDVGVIDTGMGVEPGRRAGE
jgi:DNA-binding transcriptional regulator YdaS (Cro superfamily)